MAAADAVFGTEGLWADGGIRRWARGYVCLSSPHPPSDAFAGGRQL